MYYKDFVLQVKNYYCELFFAYQVYLSVSWKYIFGGIEPLL